MTRARLKMLDSNHSGCHERCTAAFVSIGRRDNRQSRQGNDNVAVLCGACESVAKCQPCRMSTRAHVRIQTVLNRNFSDTPSIARESVEIYVDWTIVQGATFCYLWNYRANEHLGDL
jgi:hypothetical protein